MALVLYNTLGKKKEAFRPLKEGQVTMYNCGPTVYDYAHIGNFRSFMTADLLRRYLTWKGYKVRQVMNITDVGHMTMDDLADAQGEDKIEAAAKRLKKTPLEIAGYYTRAFMEDAEKLNMVKATIYPKATDHIKEMLGIIDRLVTKGYAYQAESGSVYYDVSKFRDYGKLSGNTIEQLKAGARLEVNPEKRNPVDFALWVINPTHVMQWDSSWGRGYPGWHIECSAMAMKYLGETIDIHTGGEDNIFPHHECEIAQSEGATGRPFVKCWVHTRHLMVDGAKMSKSKGNFHTLRDLEKRYDMKAVRFLMLSAHYRTKLNFTDAAVKQAARNVKSLEDFTARLKEAKGKGAKDAAKMVAEARKGFEEAMDDDLNVSLALAKLFALVKAVNGLMDDGKVAKGDAGKVLDFMLDIDRVLGLKLEKAESVWLPIKEASKPVQELLKMREGFRKKKDWAAADTIREELMKQGIILEDTPEGPKWRKAERI
jgi:cysteinyl-tRNA synthetase